ncbi:MAG TPA: hypothetical protein VGL99_21970 [Chloroflexota bacterium]
MLHLCPSRESLSRLTPLVWLLAAGAIMQAGWLLLWTVSGAARVSADVANPWLDAMDSPWDWALNWITIVGQSFPQLGALPNMNVAGSLGVALGIVGVGYLAGIVILDRGIAKLRGAGRIVIGFSLVFQLTLILIPGVFSTDVYSYLIYGQMAGVHGLNPYVVPPDALPGNPLLTWIYDDWRSLATPYGPLWTLLSAALAPLLYPLDVSDQVLIHKVLMNLVHLVNLVLLTVLLKRGLPHVRGGRLTAFALFAWNPLLLLEIAGNGHNDALMLTLLLAGLVPIAQLTVAGSNQQRGRFAWVIGMLMLGLSVLVKYATLLVGVFATVIWARELRDWRARALWVGGTLLTSSAIALALYWPWLAGLQMLGPAFDEINGKFQFHSLPVLIQRLVAEWLPTVTNLDPESAAQGARLWVYALARALFMVYIGWELKRLWTSRSERPAVQVLCAVSARALVVALLFVLTEVHSWYFTWPLTLVTLLGWRSRLTRLVVGYTLTCLPVDYIALFDWNATVPVPVRIALGLAYLGLPLILPAMTYVRRWTASTWRSRARASAAAAFAELP